MGKKVMGLVLLIPFLLACQGRSNPDIGLEINEIAEHKELTKYINLIQETILQENFLHGHVITSHLEGVIATDFYYDQQHNRIAFIPNTDEHAYYLSKLEVYDRYSISRYDLVFESLDNIRENDYLGTRLVNYNIDYTEYALPDLEEKDREDIEIVSKDIYERFSERLEKFNYDVYIGDIARGYNEGIEYVSMYLALVGDKRFYIWAEIKKKNIVSLNERVTTLSGETTPIIEKDIISNAFIKLMNMQVWLWGERAWEFHVQNKDMSYEYYFKTEYDGHEKYEKVAVLFTQATVGDVFLNGYIVYERLVEEWGKPDFEFYRHWERETLEECREELIKQGYTTKLGSGIIYFGEAKQPDFGEVNEKKTRIIIDIAKTFMKEIGCPETITSLKG